MDGEQPRRRAQSWLFTLALVALVLGTAAGVLVARQRAIDSAGRRIEGSAARAAAVAEIELADAISGLSGAVAVLDAAGEPDLEVFQRYAEDVVEAEGLGPLALVIADESAAPVRYEVLAVAPDVPDAPAAGSDVGEDAELRSALRTARRTGEPVVSDRRTTTAGPVVTVVRPLVDRGAAPGAGVGAFVLDDVAVDALLGVLGEVADPGTELALLDGDEVVAGTELDDREARTETPVAVPGQRWTVAARSEVAPDLTLAWLVAAGGGVAILAMAALVVVTVRHQRRLADANALLVRGEERSRAGQEVAGRLARALSAGDVAVALLDHLPDAVGARSVAIAVRDRAGELRLLGRDDDHDGADQPSLGVPTAGSVIDAALSLRQPAWLSSPLGWRGDELTTRLAGDGSALAVLPLSAEDVVGVLTVAYPHFHIFGDDEQALLETVGVLAARALARGRRYDAEHRAAVAFQRAALPDALPTVAGLEVAARYRPATQGATVGGDWYDVLALDEHRVLLVVGDVVGHGMVAAAAMGRLRTAFQTIVPFDADPGAMLRTVSQQVDAIPDAFCATVLAVLVDLRTGAMRWCRAGHPPPLVLAAGHHELLDQRCLPPLGVHPDLDPPVHCRMLAPGDVVVLYTDGVVERRTESLDLGFERLGLVAEQLVDLDPEDLCDALVEAMVPAESQTDDLAVLVMRYAPA